MKVEDFNYELPHEYIAQVPTEDRDGSRLLVLDRRTGQVRSEGFADILNYIDEGDCLVVNRSKVIPARLFGKKEGSGGLVECFLTKKISSNRWEAMVRPGRRMRIGGVVRFEEGLVGRVVAIGEDGTRIIDFECEGSFMDTLERIGKIPIPPYIERESNELDMDRYQTVFCDESGSVAAPTAGLHFTDELLGRIRAKGVKVVSVVLHVGIGTFKPVSVDVVEEHNMHFEEYSVPQETADIINQTRKNGGRIISVGTTSTRTLEACCDSSGSVVAGDGSTDIFIYPGYEFKVIDSLLTNFHLPKSTLIMLVSAFYDREPILSAYEKAKELGYRFFSYGDAMLIL